MIKRQDRINAVGKYLSERPNYEASPLEIRKAHPSLFVQDDTGRPDVSQTLKPMHDSGWTEKTGKRKVKLTAKGLRYFGSEKTVVKSKLSEIATTIQPTANTVEAVPTVQPMLLNGPDVLSQVLGSLPPVQSAYVEMMACAIVARHHLHETRTSFHPAFMTVGETGTGKTALAGILCRMFGFEETKHVQLIGQKAVGELRGRRAKTPMGWIYELPEEMTLPFIVFDEYDKAIAAKRDAVLHYFQGDTRVRVESAYYQDLSVPMLVANPPRNGGERYEVLRPEYRRRSFVLDTKFMKGRGAEVEAFIRTAHKMTERPVVNLQSTKPTTERVTDAAMSVLQTVPELLTDDGREEYPGTMFLETLVFGYCGLYQTKDTVEAAYRVGHTYLMCAETVGHVRTRAVQSWDECSDVADIDAWVSELTALMKEQSTEIVTRKNEVEEYAEQHEFDALTEKWAVYFEDLADEVKSPPEEWRTRENRRTYRTCANLLEKAAHQCRSAETKVRLKTVIDGNRQLVEQSKEFIEQWEEEDEEEVEAEIVDDGEDDYSPSESIRRMLTTVASSKTVVHQMRERVGGSHLANATTLRVKYGLYTYACERCRDENRKVNGVHWAEQAYNVDVAWSNGGFSNTQHLCYPCTIVTYREVEEARKAGRVSYANFFPKVGVVPPPQRQCTLCIQPTEAVCVVRYFGRDLRLKELNGIAICDYHRSQVQELTQGNSCRYNPI